MKKALLYILLIAVLGTGGWFLFKWWQNSRLSLWTFVPETALAVYEPVNLGSLFKSEDDRKILVNLKSLPGVKQVQEEFALIDSLAKSLNASQDFLGNSDLLISIHHGDLSATSLTSLFLIEVEDLSMHDYFSRLQDYLINERGFASSERNYQGYIINEFNSEDTKLAYIFYKNYLIASFSPFLVDDAVRMLEKSRTSPFTSNESFQQARTQNLFGEGRLYLQNDRISRFLSRLMKEQARDVSTLEWFSQLLYLDVSVENDRIDMTGFAALDTAEVNYLQSFQGVRGTSFQMKNVIPDHAALVAHLSFDDTDMMYEGLKKFWRKHNPGQLTGIGELENKHDFDRRSFFGLLDSEIALFVLDSKRAFAREKILAVQQSDDILAEGILKSLAQSAQQSDEAFNENYSGRSIGRIDVEELPARWFGELFGGFEQSYFMVDRNYIFVGNTLHALEVLIDDMDAENTWRKSLKTSKFLESISDDANLSLLAKGPGVWDIVTESVRGDWEQYLKDNAIAFDQMEYGAAQFSNVDNNFYTNLTIQHPGKLVQLLETNQFNTVTSTSVEASLITKPFGVRNHNDKSLEMLVQDSAFTVHLISSEGENLLKIPLKEKIATNLYQVDYYKNGKLQYLFALPHSIHMIDRTGRYIPGFPVKLPTDQPVEYLSLIDYDGKKDYRILVATEKSFYYMYDRTGKLLKGWNPKKLTGGPAMPGQHLRVRSADFMLFIQGNGTVHGLTRRGLAKKGFPLDLKGNVSSPMYINRGSSLETTELVAVTDNGDLIEFNLLGNVIRRDQFYKENLEDQFVLVNSHDSKKYLVVQLTSDKILIHNENLEKLFEVDKRSTNYDFQYYSFGSGNEVIVSIDKSNGVTNLYSLDGVKLHKEPIESSQKIAMLYHEIGDLYEIYSSSSNQLLHLTLQR